MKTLIYLHGFNSSPDSEKACLTKNYFNHHSTNLSVSVPALQPSPLAAMAQVKALIESFGVESIAGFIGSSLGGYYSLYLQQQFNLPVVLINPAMRPYDTLHNYLGENINLYTGERYIVELSHMDDLKSLAVSVKPNPRKILLLVQTGDEVLDAHQSIAQIDGAKMWIQSGGDHSFENFSDVLPAVKDFFMSSLDVKK